MTTPVWQPGTRYSPGDLVIPRALPAVTQTQPDNPSFGDGGGSLNDWTESFENGTGTWTASSALAFDGSTSALFTADPGGTGVRSGVLGILRNAFLAPVRPGQRINFSCRVARFTAPNNLSNENAGARIYWFDSAEVLLSFSLGNTQGVADTPPGMVGGAGNGEWILHTGSAIAPANAAFAQFGIAAWDNTVGLVYVDDCRWDYVFQSFPSGLAFRAVQSAAGYSGNAEPAWPTVNGQQVVDNEVTWEAVTVSRVTWEARPLLVSGEYEPDFPLEVNGTVADGTIAWTTLANRVTDEKLPQSKVVAIGASKIFAADDDIIGFSATTNPLDWSTLEDAGFLPFGLQSHGATSCSALSLYRGNLMAFNSEGYQMWQIDEDPQNMAFLDAAPIDCVFPKSLQPVANDLALLTSQGVRNIGIAGASTNLQAGFFGKHIDPLILSAVRAIGTTITDENVTEPISLFWPGAGQYWLIFGSEAFVLTLSGAMKDSSWSRYVFPATIEAAAILDGELYLRTGDHLVWRVSDEALQDDVDTGTDIGGDGIPFTGYMSWPYLDFGALGIEKRLEGFDLVVTGSVTVQFGYNQKDETLVTDAYTLSGDTLPGTMIPMPLTAPSLQLRLTFAANQEWEWNAASLYFLPDQEHP